MAKPLLGKLEFDTSSIKPQIDAINNVLGGIGKGVKFDFVDSLLAKLKQVEEAVAHMNQQLTQLGVAKAASGGGGGLDALGSHKK